MLDSVTACKALEITLKKSFYIVIKVCGQLGPVLDTERIGAVLSLRTGDCSCSDMVTSPAEAGHCYSETLVFFAKAQMRGYQLCGDIKSIF